ncbi:flagellar motility protein MotE (MotC chaperone) [Palleronia aestuarii]|uniref:Flagellar motility protein MotE (MotC chaperone) n=2 Tax=Palleronia aestuarii TaxID=568105 RepID=A0A2W7NPB4_9RHOB|nr:flagellar motility protein MotE (MotC chaperone) [Palleronia aestuarii]
MNMPSFKADARRKTASKKATPRKSKLRSGMRTFGIGALPLLASLSVASGLIRLGDGTGQAIAREIGALTTSAETNAATVAATDEVANVLAALESRQAALDEREAALDERETRIGEAREALRDQLAELEAAETELSALLQQVETAAEDDLTRLTTVYESMKPRDASALFETMAPAFAAGFLGRMRPDAAAGIMAGLSPEVAYSVSVMMAGRHADLPRE